MNNLRNRLRILTRNRWHSATIMLILALSIGALTSVVSVVSAVLLKPYGPVATDRWVYLWEHRLNSDRARQISASVPNFLDWKRESAGVFSDVVLWLPWSYTASRRRVIFRRGGRRQSTRLPRCVADRGGVTLPLRFDKSWYMLL